MKMSHKDICPKCKIDLSYKHTDGETYSHVVGIEDMFGYDGVSWFFCPECLHMWKRFDWSPDPKTSKVCIEYVKEMKKQRMSKDIKDWIDDET